MTVAYSAKDDSFAAGRPRPWSNTQIGSIGPGVWNLDVTPDGKRFVVVGSPPADSAAAKNSVHVTFLLNFFDEVRRRIPTRK
jgi:serine/threonine-protein kinase